MLPNRALPYTLVALAICIVLIVLGASWVPESQMTRLPWLPTWLANIADFHPQLRTAVPFIPLALVLGSLLALAGVRHPDRTAFIICLLCVGIAEAGQIFLPSRTADLRDVLCGALGALGGITIRQILKTRPKKQAAIMPDEQNPKNWIVCQIGARENYTIPRALHQAGRLNLLLTDIWNKPGGIAGDLVSKGSMFQRWHPDLADAGVRAANRSHLTFEAFTRARNNAKSWSSIIRRNERFQRNCTRILRQHADSMPATPITVFAFSYAARDIFQFAKSRGWTTVLGQIDPGPHEETLVAEEHRRHPIGTSTWRPAPPAYWDHWREEIDLADQIIVNSPWSRDGLVAAGVPLEKIRIVPLFYEADEKRTADLQSAPQTPATRGAGILPAAAPDQGPPTPDATQSQDQGPRTKDSAEGATDQERDAVAPPLQVLFIGNVCLRKGIARLIEAMRLLRGQPIHLSIYGHLSVSPDLWAGLPNVSWAGAVRNPDIREVYAAADVFILPTISDGFARTQLEALASGTPVIATRNCGKVVIHGVNGFLLEHNTPQEIANLLTTIAADRSLLTKCDTARLPDGFPQSLDTLASLILNTP